MKALVKKELISLAPRQSLASARKYQLQQTVVLNKDQQEASAEVCRDLDTFKTYLLNGVPGSGKTEVYLRVIEEKLQQLGVSIKRTQVPTSQQITPRKK